MDDSAFQLFDSVGLGWNQLREKFGTPGTPLVDAHAQFRGPSKFDDRLDVASWVSEWGRSSFTVSHRFSRGDHVLVEGWEKRVWVSFDPDDAAKITTRPIPDEVKAAFAVD
jgi:4-hydroxybenzoyl-CoA thioesterase